METLKPGGVYRHFKGDFYVVLFTTDLVTDVKKDQDVPVYIAYGAGYAALYAGDDDEYVKEHATEDAGSDPRRLFTARAHADYTLVRDETTPGGYPLDVAVYVPLYTRLPGRRISVRDVEDFFEMVEIDLDVGNDMGVPTKVQRFTYVGDTIPEAK